MLKRDYCNDGLIFRVILICLKHGLLWPLLLARVVHSFINNGTSEQGGSQAVPSTTTQHSEDPLWRPRPILLISSWGFSIKMPTTIKAALKKWEEASGKKSAEAKEIKLIGCHFWNDTKEDFILTTNYVLFMNLTYFIKGVYPPIEKLEGPLHILVNCEKLSLSTNLIVNIQNLQVLSTIFSI